MLMMMWNNLKSCTLLVGMQNGASKWEKQYGSFLSS